LAVALWLAKSRCEDDLETCENVVALADSPDVVEYFKYHVKIRGLNLLDNRLSETVRISTRPTAQHVVIMARVVSLCSEHCACIFIGILRS